MKKLVLHINLSILTSNSALLKFLENNSLLTLIRSNSFFKEGFKNYYWHNSKFPTIVSIFSSPNYKCNIKNKSAILIIDNDNLEIKQFKSTKEPYFLSNFLNLFEFSWPYIIDNYINMVNILLGVNKKKINNKKLWININKDTINKLLGNKIINNMKIKLSRFKIKWFCFWIFFKIYKKLKNKNNKY